MLTNSKSLTLHYFTKTHKYNFVVGHMKEYAATLKALSEGTDVAGIQRYFLAMRYRTGKCRTILL